MSIFNIFGSECCPVCDNPHYDGDYCDECGYDSWDDWDDPDW